MPDIEHARHQVDTLLRKLTKHNPPFDEKDRKALVARFRKALTPPKPRAKK